MSDLQIVGCGASLETASCVAKSLGHNVKSVDIGISIEEGLKAFIHDFAGGAVFLALGPEYLNFPRSTAVKAMLGKGMQLVSLVSPLASIHPNCKIGKGVFIGPFSMIGAAVHLSDGVWIEDYAKVAQGSSLGSFSWIGSRATLNGSKIGTHVTVGAGATVENIEVGGRCVLEKPMLYDVDLQPYTHFLQNMRGPVIRL